MAYADIDSIKKMLGITDASFDDVLTELVSNAENEINAKLDVDWLLAWEATEIVRYKDIRVKSWGLYWHARFAVRNFPVVSLDEINGETYTWTLGIRNDYFIESNRYINLTDLNNYTTNDKFEFIEVKYTYGYDELPEDIKLAANYWVCASFKKEYPMYSFWGTTAGTWPISSYKIGDESIQFFDSAVREDMSKSANSDLGKFHSLLAKYRKVYVS